MRKLYKNIKSNLIIFIALGFFIYFIYVAFGGSGLKDDSKIWVLAKHSVESKLKAPNSAKFPSKSKADILRIGDKYIIKSYVDADNSFGSPVRSRFTVTLIRSTVGEYITESVDIE
ncbi:hypothetical protein [Clostridium sp.]|uniref:hypothetical protein n=1 Tax=Clostridium sp. TaxID=1506 RepID=UPI001DA741CC|nr:hypothetical protein [Clostridium sp.]MBS5307788.1 hypothetical protein [Clostridium sp.]